MRADIETDILEALIDGLFDPRQRRFHCRAGGPAVAASEVGDLRIERGGSRADRSRRTLWTAAGGRRN